MKVFRSCNVIIGKMQNMSLNLNARHAQALGLDSAPLPHLNAPQVNQNISSGLNVTFWCNIAMFFSRASFLNIFSRGSYIHFKVFESVLIFYIIANECIIVYLKC